VTASGGTGFAAGQNGTINLSSNLAGPNVISQTPSGTTYNSFNIITLTFDSPINPSSLAMSNVSVTTPALLQTDVITSLELVNDNELEIMTSVQSAPGFYGISVSNVQDIYGVPMAAPYSGSIYIALPPVPLTVIPASQPGAFSMVWNGSGGINYQVQSSTDLVHWQPFGEVMAASNGINSIALPVGSDPGTFFRLVPAN
jgi:hypothetical protein